VRVVDGNEQGPASREVGGQPVQAVQHGERRVVGRPLDDLAEEQGSHRSGRPGEQRLALVRAGTRQAPLEQLARHAEGEVGFELGPAGAQDLLVAVRCPPARCLDQRRLTDARPTLDHEDAAALQQHVDGRQLALALQQLLHEISLIPNFTFRAGAPS
jgi:hypothetical protein